MKKIKIDLLREIVRDFMNSGVEISTASFEDWYGQTLDIKCRNYINKVIWS